MYTANQIEVELAVAQAFTSTGDKVTWAPGFIPWYVRNVSVTITTAFTVTAAVINFTTRGTAGSNAGITAGDIAILNILTTYVAPNTIYAKTPPVEKLLKPGQELVVNCGTASTAGNANVNIFIETSIELPLNNANMIQST